VTRLDDFSHNELLFYLGSFSKITAQIKFLGYYLCSEKLQLILSDTLGHILGDFFSISSGHPGFAQNRFQQGSRKLNKIGNAISRIFCSPCADQCCQMVVVFS
jgi:hypothetical protein